MTVISVQPIPNSSGNRPKRRGSTSTTSTMVPYSRKSSMSSMPSGDAMSTKSIRRRRQQLQAKFNRAVSKASPPMARPMGYALPIEPMKLETSNSFDISKIFTDIISIIRKTTDQPIFIVMSAIVFALVVASGPTVSSGPLGSQVNSSVAVNGTIGTWIRNNPTKFYGMLIFLPSVYSVPAQYSFVAGVLAIAWVMIVPEYTVFEYLIQSMALYIYFKTRAINTRTFITVITVLAYYIGYLVISPGGVAAKACACYDGMGYCRLDCSSMSLCYDSLGDSVPCV